MLRLTLAAILLIPCALAAPADTFSKKLYPVLEAAGCRNCHNPDGAASITRLHFPEFSASPDRIEAFGKSLVMLVDRQHPEQSLLLNKPTLRIPHTGGERIKPGSDEERTLRDWIARLASFSGEELAEALKYREQAAAAAGPAPRVVLRRLTHSQYNNTVHDLLGDSTAPANQFPPEDYVNGFKNQYQAQNLSPLLGEAYGAAAEKLARSAFRGGDTRNLIPCKARDAACRARFVREFGRKAFRRPLDAEEQKRYEALFAKQGDFLQGAQIVVEAMLQSPHFLFRLEQTSNLKWKPYATAGRLSYALWDSMPDEALFEAAARGELATPQGVEKAARRLLADPRARQALDEFVSQWMRLDRVLATSKDRRRFPQFTRELAVAMAEETRQFLADLIWNDRNFLDLFRADYSFVNADLAAVYGVPAPAKEFDRVVFAPQSERAGLLGQLTFLTLTAKPDDTSPTARGLFVREQFLCQHVADPPPGVNTNLPPLTVEKPQTNRKRLAVHLSSEVCATCHKLIDPIGFGFEKFDAIGGRREKLHLTFFGGRRDRDAKPQTVDLDLDTSGWVAGVPDSQFQSPRELGEILARAPQCQECVVKQLFRYTAGRTETPADQPLLARCLDDFRDSQFRYKELIISMIRWMEFPPPGRAPHGTGDHQTQ